MSHAQLSASDVSALAPPVGWLECPVCGGDARPTRKIGCLQCGGVAVHDSAEPECSGEMVPVWDEDDDGPCENCGHDLRVAVDDVKAYAVEVEP